MMLVDNRILKFCVVVLAGLGQAVAAPQVVDADRTFSVSLSDPSSTLPPVDTGPPHTIFPGTPSSGILSNPSGVLPSGLSTLSVTLTSTPSITGSVTIPETSLVSQTTRTSAPSASASATSPVASSVIPSAPAATSNPPSAAMGLGANLSLGLVGLASVLTALMM